MCMYISRRFYKEKPTQLCWQYAHLHMYIRVSKVKRDRSITRDGGGQNANKLCKQPFVKPTWKPNGATVFWVVVTVEASMQRKTHPTASQVTTRQKGRGEIGSLANRYCLIYIRCEGRSLGINEREDRRRGGMINCLIYYY